jgi:hypothetical protein
MLGLIALVLKHNLLDSDVFLNRVQSDHLDHVLSVSLAQSQLSKSNSQLAAESLLVNLSKSDSQLKLGKGFQLSSKLNQSSLQTSLSTLGESLLLSNSVSESFDLKSISSNVDNKLVNRSFGSSRGGGFVLLSFGNSGLILSSDFLGFLGSVLQNSQVLFLFPDGISELISFSLQTKS